MLLFACLCVRSDMNQTVFKQFGVTGDVCQIPFRTLSGFLVQRAGAGSLLQQCKQRRRRPAPYKSVAALRQQQRLSEAG